MKTCLVIPAILMLMLAGGCQTRWMKLDGGSVDDGPLEEARQACRLDRKLQGLARAEEQRDRGIASAGSNEATMLVREEFDLVRMQVYAEIDACMRRQGYKREN